MPINYGALNVSTSGALVATSGAFLEVAASNGTFTDNLTVSGIQVSLIGHTHNVVDIANFNSAVSGLLPVKNIIAGSGVQINSTSGEYTINVSTGSFSVEDSIINALIFG